MRLDVCLVIDIETILITQLIELPVLRIVAKTNRIEVITLHQLEVLAHQLLGDVVTRLRVMLVDIDTLELDRLSVEEQNRVGLTVPCKLVDRLDLQPTETNPGRNDLQGLSLLFHTHQQLIEVRMLSTPFRHIREVSSKRCLLRRSGAYPYLFCLRSHALPRSIQQFIRYPQITALPRMVLQVDR